MRGCSMMNTEQSRAFLTESMHALLMDIFCVEISRSEDSTEIQSIESLIQKYDKSGDGSEISDADVRNTIKIVCKYCQGISEHEQANNDLMDFYANSLKSCRSNTSRVYGSVGSWKKIRLSYIMFMIILWKSILSCSESTKKNRQRDLDGCAG